MAQWSEKVGTSTSSERLVSRSERVVAPPGEALPDWEVLARFARAMGYSGFDYDAPEAVCKATASGPGFGPPMQPGEVCRLGPYRIIKQLGRGGMGAVYAALDTRLNRKLALKVMLPEFAASPSARCVARARACAIAIGPRDSALRSVSPSSSSVTMNGSPPCSPTSCTARMLG